MDLPRVGVRLAMGEANLSQSERARSRVGQEQAGAEAESLSNGVLEQSVRDRDRRPEQVAAGPDCLANGVTSMEHHLEVEVRDGGAGGTR